MSSFQLRSGYICTLIIVLALPQDDVAFQTTSLLMDQASGNNLSSGGFTGRSNSSCASNMPVMPMPAATKPAQQETEQTTKSAPSTNKRKNQTCCSLELVSSDSLAPFISRQSKQRTAGDVVVCRTVHGLALPDHSSPSICRYFPLIPCCFWGSFLNLGRKRVFEHEIE